MKKFPNLCQGDSMGLSGFVFTRFQAKEFDFDRSKTSLGEISKWYL